MNSSEFIGQLKQNNIQINNLKGSFAQTEKHMIDHEKVLTNEVNLFIEQQNSELKTHIENTLNPHNVTKSQVGLSNVINETQATKTEFDIHKDDKNNPHLVTKAQVGLDLVDNIRQASKADFDTHNADTNRHVTTDDKTKWNNAQLYKISSDSGLHKLGLANKDLFIELANARTSTFYTNSTTTNNPNGTVSLRGLQIGQDGISEVLGMGNDGTTWRNTQSNGWKSWRRLIDTADLSFTWNTATLQNGWKHYNGSVDVQYGIDFLGNVYIRGAAKDGAINTAVFTLPSGYRPSRSFNFISSNSTGSSSPSIARISVGTDGIVTIESVEAGNSYVRVDTIFRV
ncbi:hypothetical protein MOC76_16155 [Bacillus spizizenii]|uniref:hypothetical protein n=1 Tax=Bacillus spizizenii TaxID=96241 RepID=UPI00228148C5|nr:hypothetical protein [Bacillus spizizenii]MCY8063825.1 hypothetical protein [Bacillus spizizenii]MCY8135295.1 hypothetical protein [Bacillus spizizenii]MCY8256871.1 hypothetical protein [Bacillus spizizenii]MCY8335419.1 hypothetical protein [Bacillus spizizenii]MCY9443542.1 hypothetical protein [Bacillus spizizenii]